MPVHCTKRETKKERLARKIIALSRADDFQAACTEWDVECIYRNDEPTTCICGQTNVIEVVFIRNFVTNEIAIVGNHCARWFDLDFGKVFSALKKIETNIGATVNSEALNFALATDWINNWDWNFYCDIAKKTHLTPKQLAKKQEINQKILDRCVRKGVSHA